MHAVTHQWLDSSAAQPVATGGYWIGSVGPEAAANRKRTLTKIRDLLVDLGKEALNENAAWLQMHRVHPVRPPQPE